MSNVASFRSRFLLWVNPLVKWISRQHLPDTHKEIDDGDLIACRKLWRPGDILLTRIEGEGTDLIITGFFKHAAMVLDDTGIIQATAPGVNIEDAVDFFVTKDVICLLRPKFATAAEAATAVAWAKTQLGKPYDYELSDSLAAFYCSKVAFDAYKITMGDKCPLQMHLLLDATIYEPQNFFDDTANFEHLWDSRDVVAPTPVAATS